MIIQCEACRRKFRVDESKIAPPGVKMRCSKCGDVFFFEYKNDSGEVDQDVLEQKYARGAVSKSTSSNDSTVPPTARRTFKTKNRKSFFEGLFSWFLTLLILGMLFFSSMFLLNETKIYENDYFSIIKGVTNSEFVSDNSRNNLLRSIIVKNKKTDWYSSKYGQVYVVSGEIVNRSRVPVNFIKLRSQFILTGEQLFEQEFYPGNTLTNWEIKNSSFEIINRKLNKKRGDLNYEDVDNLAGLNFDIQPGESIPFYTVFPAKNKILGLKHKIKVIDLETTNVEEKS